MKKLLCCLVVCSFFVGATGCKPNEGRSQKTPVANTGSVQIGDESVSFTAKTAPNELSIELARGNYRATVQIERDMVSFISGNDATVAGWTPNQRDRLVENLPMSDLEKILANGTVWPSTDVAATFTVLAQLKEQDYAPIEWMEEYIWLWLWLAYQNQQDADGDPTGEVTPPPRPPPPAPPLTPAPVLVNCTNTGNEPWNLAALDGSVNLLAVPVIIEGKVVSADGESECLDEPPAACDEAPGSAVTGNISEIRVANPAKVCGDDDYDKASSWSGTVKSAVSQTQPGCTTGGKDELTIANLVAKYNNITIAVLNLGKNIGNMKTKAEVNISISSTFCEDDDVLGDAGATGVFSAKNAKSCYNTGC